MSRMEQAQSSRFTWPQILSLIVGALFFLVGLVGFVPTGLDHFATHGGGDTIMGFGINPLHNIVHIVIGLAGLAASTSLRAARGFGWFLLIAYGLALIFGLFAVNRPNINFLNLNVADNWLHGISALIGALIAAGATSMLKRSTTRGQDTMTTRPTVTGTDVRDRSRLAERYDDRRDTVIRDYRQQTGPQVDPRTAPSGPDTGAHRPGAPSQRLPEHDVPERLRRGYDDRQNG